MPQTGQHCHFQAALAHLCLPLVAGFDFGCAEVKLCHEHYLAMHSILPGHPLLVKADQSGGSRSGSERLLEDARSMLCGNLIIWYIGTTDEHRVPHVVLERVQPERESKSIWSRARAGA